MVEGCGHARACRGASLRSASCTGTARGVAKNLQGSAHVVEKRSGQGRQWGASSPDFAGSSAHSSDASPTSPPEPEATTEIPRIVSRRLDELLKAQEAALPALPPPTKRAPRSFMKSWPCPVVRERLFNQFEVPGRQRCAVGAVPGSAVGAASRCHKATLSAPRTRPSAMIALFEHKLAEHVDARDARSGTRVGA